MLKKIESLRKQPVHVRNRYAFWSAFLVTLVIAGLWATTLPARFEDQEATEENEVLSSEWSAFATTMQKLFVGTIEQFGAVTAEQVKEKDEGRIDLVELVASSTAAGQAPTPPRYPTSTASTTASTSTRASSTPQSN